MVEQQKKKKEKKKIKTNTGGNYKLISESLQEFKI